MSTSTLQIRMDPKIRSDAELVFDQLGISSTQAVKLFFRQVTLKRGIPFTIELPEEIEVLSDEDERNLEIAANDFASGRYTEIDMNDKKQVSNFFGI